MFPALLAEGCKQRANYIFSGKIGLFGGINGAEVVYCALKEKLCHCFLSISALIQSWPIESSSPCVSVSLWEKVESHSDAAISHSVKLPQPTSGHVDCIRIGQPGARLEGRGHLSYLWTETWAEEKYLKWGVRLFTLPHGEQTSSPQRGLFTPRVCPFKKLFL